MIGRSEVTRLEDARAALDRRPARLRARADFDQHASVALVLVAEPDDLSLLFIRRREHPSDPWSGHTAFPGGRLDPGDDDARAAAERETFEEVGVDLASAAALGRLDDLAGRSASLLVSGFVYGLRRRPALTPNHEVDVARCMPLREIESTDHHLLRDFDYLGQSLYLPALRVFDPPAAPLWGLSYRFLELFMRIIGRPIPAMPWDEEL